jgi:hypothetical protein
MAAILNTWFIKDKSPYIDVSFCMLDLIFFNWNTDFINRSNTGSFRASPCSFGDETYAINNLIPCKFCDIRANDEQSNTQWAHKYNDIHWYK